MHRCACTYASHVNAQTMSIDDNHTAPEYVDAAREVIHIHTRAISHYMHASAGRGFERKFNYVKRPMRRH
jgi:hypothetical protein